MTSSNYLYNGVTLDSIFSFPTSRLTQATKVLCSTSTSYIDTVGNFTQKSNYSAEIYESDSVINYSINGIDITNYASPVFVDYTSSSVTVTPPSWATKVTIICIGAGGGGGSGGSGFYSQQQAKATQSGGNGGGGAAGAYTMYRGYQLPQNKNLSLFIGSGGAGGIDASSQGGAGQNSYVKIDTTTILNASGGFGGTNGAQGNNSSTQGGGGTSFTYQIYGSTVYNGNSATTQATTTAGSVITGGSLNIPTGYIPDVSGYSGGGGLGGTGSSNNSNSGRTDGATGKNGYIRLYWLP